MKHILLMNGPDNKGLIYNVTHVLYNHNQNIISQDEYVSPSKQFFMRTEFEGEGDPEKIINDLYSTLPNGINLRLNPKKRKTLWCL